MVGDYLLLRHVHACAPSTCWAATVNGPLPPPPGAARRWCTRRATGWATTTRSRAAARCDRGPRARTVPEQLPTYGCIKYRRSSFNPRAQGCLCAPSPPPPTRKFVQRLELKNNMCVLTCRGTNIRTPRTTSCEWHACSCCIWLPAAAAYRATINQIMWHLYYRDYGFDTCTTVRLLSLPQSHPTDASPNHLSCLPAPDKLTPCR